jgi:hypothetical protein
MKGFFKLTTAALALVAFASCSNDDLFGDGQAVADGQASNTLQVEVEQLVDGVTTRAAYVPNGTANQLYWENGDVIEVFDETMLQNDTYEYSWKRTTFENNAKKDLVKTPAYAFTTDAWSTMASCVWDTKKDQNIVTYDISDKPFWTEDIVNNEIASTKGNQVKAYRFSLPMWGTAQKTDAGVSVSMKYLTGVLRVQMAQLPEDVTRIRITGWKDQAATIQAPMTGTFKAVIAEEDEVDPDAQLVELTPYDQTGAGLAALGLTGFTPIDNRFVIRFDEMDPEELTNMRAHGGYVYIPLIAQKYGALQFWYWDTKTTSWKLYKKTKPFEAKRGTVYRMNIEEFEIAGSDAESLNVLLEQKKDVTGPVIVPTTYPTEMKTGKNVITIPAGFKAESLTLDLQGISSGTEPFELESEDGEYKGDVVIDLSNASVVPTQPIFLNLPNSNVTLKGDFGGQDVGSASQNKLIVKSLTIAPISEDDADQGFLATNVGDIIASYESFSTGEGIEVQKDATVGNINMQRISENGDKFIKKSKIVIKGTAGNINAGRKDPAYTVGDKKDYYQDIPVTVEGGTTGRITTASPIILTDATVGGPVVSIWSDVIASGTTNAAARLEATNENVIMSGKATALNAIAPKVELSEEANVRNMVTTKTLSIVGTAWAQHVTMNADGSATINLTEEGEAIKGTFSVNNAAITLTQGYINTINKTAATGKKAELTFGEVEGFTAIGSFTGTGDFEFKNASTWNGKKIGKKGDTDFTVTYTAGNYIYTAVQLASNPYSAAWLSLENDIDLNNEAWTPLKLQTSFNGAGTGKSIKNLKVTGADDKGTGLFASSEGTGAIIGGLTIDGAEISAAGKTNVGVIAGIANAAVVIKNVTIKNATVTGKYNVGGLIGNSKAIDITNADVAGITFANPDAKKSEPALSADPDKKAGSIGRYVGYLGGDFKADKDAAGTLDMKDLGFWANLKKNGGNGYFYYPGTINCGLFNVAVSTYQVGTTTITGANIFSDTYTGTVNEKADKAAAAGSLGCYVLASEWKK